MIVSSVKPRCLFGTLRSPASKLARTQNSRSNASAHHRPACDLSQSNINLCASPTCRTDQLLLGGSVQRIQPAHHVWLGPGAGFASHMLATLRTALLQQLVRSRLGGVPNHTGSGGGGSISVSQRSSALTQFTRIAPAGSGTPAARARHSLNASGSRPAPRPLS